MSTYINNESRLEVMRIERLWRIQQAITQDQKKGKDNFSSDYKYIIWLTIRKLLRKKSFFYWEMIMLERLMREGKTSVCNNPSNYSKYSWHCKSYQLKGFKTFCSLELQWLYNVVTTKMNKNKAWCITKANKKCRGMDGGTGGI